MKISRPKRWRRETTCPSKGSLSIAAILLAVILPEALPLQAQERQQQQEAPTTLQEGRRVHVVRTGDTLWDLASFYLTDPFLWPEIYRLNTMVIEDPHWIYPEEQLLVPGPEDVVEVAIEIPVEPEPEPEPGELPPDQIDVEPMAPLEPQVIEGATTVFAQRQLDRQTLTYQPLPPVPAVAVTWGDFYRSAVLIQLQELGPHGEVVDVTAPRGVEVRPQATILRYGRTYISHPDGEAPQVGERLLLYRIERRIKPYGYVVRPTGLVTIAAVHEDVSTAIVTELYEFVQVGNRATRAELFRMEPGVFAEPVATGPAGELVALLDEQHIASVEDLVFVNVGRSQGVGIGDEFELYASGRRSATGLRLPEEHIGVGRVMRVTEATATLRMIDMRHPGINIGLPVRLIRKMPS